MLEIILRYVVYVALIIAGAMIFKTWIEGQRQKKKQFSFILEMVQKAETKFITHYNEGNQEKVKEALAKGFSMFFNTLPYRVDNLGEAMRNYTEVMKDGEKQSIFNMKAVPLGEHVAIVSYNWMRGKQSGKTTHVWQQQVSGQWQLVHDHTTHNPA